MATTIINPPSPDYPVLTSALYSISAHTDKTKILVELVRDPDGEMDCFFSTTLYPLDGIVELSDIGSLIEQRFRTKDKIWAPMEIRFDGVSAEFIALYCKYALDPEFEYDKTFLSAAGESIVHRDSAVSLTHWSNGSTEYRVQIVGLDSDGKTLSVERTFTKKKDSDFVSFSVNDIINFALGKTEDGVDTGIVKVAYFAVSYGEMQKLFYLTEHPFFLTFGYRNIFNAHEYLDVVCTVKRKMEFSRETAICSGKVKQYNHVAECTYEVQTDSLTNEQIRELEQLIGSHDVQICAPGFDYDVIITDHTIEDSTDDESLSSVKFTFRFVGERPQLVNDDMGSLMPARTHVFSEEFTAEFT